MAWIHKGRKYWYHNGKRYSCKLKRRSGGNGYFVAPSIRKSNGYFVAPSSTKKKEKRVGYFIKNKFSGEEEQLGFTKWVDAQYMPGSRYKPNRYEFYERELADDEIEVW